MNFIIPIKKGNFVFNVFFILDSGVTIVVKSLVDPADLLEKES
jgi:hypothetical protein